MAEVFLSAIAKTVLGKIVSLAFNVNPDLRKLKETMSRIKAVLLDAERKQYQDEKLRLCMEKLKDIFYDAEDIIDDIRCEDLRKQVVKHPNVNLKVRFLSSCFLPLLFSLRMDEKIKGINQRLDELATEWNSFNLGPCSENRLVFHRETLSSVNSFDVLGRDDDKANIIDLLKRPSEDGVIAVIPIVGFGGIGKTALVQSVYNDDHVATLFPLKGWISVSDEFYLHRLLKLIVKAINVGENCDGSFDDLQNRLRGLLNGKRFLLVLDDVWNENRAA
ncbi:hypothetical protein V6N12_015493 [Hibiscus sabdariffa]|uniref:Uncharacterized protein n=1 Tax=Hibiscus sabdariffa TaxID=183260 RepID=A0ABR2DPV5_9ROSI